MSTSNHFLNALRADVVLLGKLPMSRSALGVFISDCSHFLSRQRRLRKLLATSNTLRVSASPVPVPGSGTLWHSASPVLLSALNRLWARAAAMAISAGGIQSVLRSCIKGVVLDGSTEEVAPIAAARRVTRVAGKQGKDIASMVEQVGNAVRTSHRAVGLEQSVSILVSRSFPRPTLVRTSYVNLRPEPSDVGVGEGWQGLRNGHVEPPFLASLRQFYQKGGF